MPRDQEKTKLRHIQVESEEVAEEVILKLGAGDTWEDLALEYSQDPLTKDSGGDLGWMTESTIRYRFGTSAESIFTEAIGNIVRAIPSTQGWHLIEIMGREMQSLNAGEYQQALNDEFDARLSEMRASAEITIADDWFERLPDAPDFDTG